MTLQEIRELYPQLDADEYARTIFIWTYSLAPMPILPSRDYRRYFRKECGIERPMDFHIRMIREDYFRPLFHAETVRVLSEDYLREMAVQLSCEAAEDMDKKELVECVHSRADRTYYESLVLPVFYTVTKKGKIYIAQHDELVEIHRKVRDMEDCPSGNGGRNEEGKQPDRHSQTDGLKKQEKTNEWFPCGSWHCPCCCPACRCAVFLQCPA